MFKFQGKTYKTENELEEALYDYADRTFDDYLNTEFGKVELADRWYDTSEVLKAFKIGRYKTMLADYFYSLYDEVEEI